MREICTSGLTRGAANPPLLYNLGGSKANPTRTQASSGSVLRALCVRLSQRTFGRHRLLPRATPYSRRTFYRNEPRIRTYNAQKRTQNHAKIPAATFFL